MIYPEKSAAVSDNIQSTNVGSTSKLEQQQGPGNQEMGKLLCCYMRTE